MKTNFQRPEKNHIVVIGGGFAGLNFVKKLFDNPFFRITVVDKNNYNYFTPLLYQVATSFLEPASISYPFRKLFKRKAGFIMASLLRVDTKSNIAYLSNGSELHYNYLVFAAGSKPNFFGNEVFRQKALVLKQIDDALEMRNAIVRSLENASIEEDVMERQKWLTVVIAGGGPTGVELAGMLAEMKEHIALEYPEMKDVLPEVYLVDPAPNLLGPMSDKSHRAAKDVLTKSGVHIKLNTHIVSYENDSIYLSDGDVIDAKTMIWAAGVIANTFEGISGDSLGKGNRMITDEFNKVIGYDNVFAIGDISIQHGDKAYPVGHPQLAQPAIQQGKTLARNIAAIQWGHAMKPFRYFDRGDMAIIGRKYAVADLFKNKIHIGGIPGLLAWLFIHLISLVNYNNKFKTLYSWTIAYLTSDQSLRMIFRTERTTLRAKEPEVPMR